MLPARDAATAMAVAVGGPSLSPTAKQSRGGGQLLLKLARDMEHWGGWMSQVIWGECVLWGERLFC